MAGMGMDNCIAIAADAQGCMLADALEAAIVDAKVSTHITLHQTSCQ
jgi:hypothetical protein